MMRSKVPVLRAATVAALALTMSACVSLLPKTKPVDLYRFGLPAAAGSENATPASGRIGVFRANSTFQRESAGDRLLTISQGKVAYVAETRWVAPASILWDQAVSGAFDADTGKVRLVSRGEAAAADYLLRLDVRNFETRYTNGPKAAPTIVVRVRAAMASGKDKGLVGEKIFERQVTAADNRVSAIVPAYDQASAAVLKDIVAWTNSLAAPV